MKRAISLAFVAVSRSPAHSLSIVLTIALSVVLAGQTYAQDIPRGGWTGSQTIGAGTEGYAVGLLNGVYEVTGSGIALFMGNQQFHYLYKELSGDGAITCRVVDNGIGSNDWSKGGVMIRDTLDPGSAHCTTVVTGGSGGGAGMEWRAAAVSAGGKEKYARGSGAPPLWVRVERIEDDFSCFLSEDGDHWTQVGSTETIPMTDPALIGLCVCSHAAGELRTFTFDNVSFEGDVTGEIPPEAAQDPLPDHEATDVPCDIQLSWNPGVFAETHNVYFGASWDDVNDASVDNPMGVLASEGQTATSFGPNRLLDFGQTYYWRIDEVNGTPDNTIFKGTVWSLTTEPLGYPIEGVIASSNMVPDLIWGPEKTVDGSGLNESDQHSVDAADMWLGVAGSTDPAYIQYEFDRVYRLHEMLVWNYNVIFELTLGFGLKGVTVEYSADGAEWTVLTDVEFAQATAKSDYVANTTVEFNGVLAKHVRLTVNSGWGPMGQFGLSEVRFLYIPTRARAPQPGDGETEVDLETILSWRAGREAVLHEIYFSTDREAVADGTTLIDAVLGSSYQPGFLEAGQTYYWKVNEVNEAESVGVWEGDVWEFSTVE